MLYIIFSIDRPGAQPLRDATRAAHIEYLDRFRDIVVLGGGLLNDEGTGHRGCASFVNVK
ncbi:MAG: YciI family protein, partial [Burkholderiaceae bacterium]